MGMCLFLKGNYFYDCFDMSIVSCGDEYKQLHALVQLSGSQ